MQDSPSVVALREHLRAIVTAHPMPLDVRRHDELRGRVCAVVDELKSAEWSPERVVVAVKQIALDAGLVTHHPGDAGRPTLEKDAAQLELVGWSIKQYFGERSPARDLSSMS